MNVSLSSDHWRPQSHLSIFRVNNEPTHDLDLQQKAGDTWKGMIARTGDGTTALSVQHNSGFKVTKPPINYI